MKRLTALILMLLLVLSDTSLAEAADESLLKNPDTFYDDHADAPLYTSSQFFDIHFCAFDDPEAEAGRDELHGIMFALAVTGVKADYPEFKMTAHFNTTLQSVLVSSEWYNEPIDLYSEESGKVPHGAFIPGRPWSICGAWLRRTASRQATFTMWFWN